MRGLCAVALCLVASATAIGQSAPRSLGRATVREVVQYVVSRGETFETIGARLGVNPLDIARRNTRWVRAPLAAGTKLSIDAHRIVPAGFEEGLVINVPQRRLFVAGDDGVPVALPVAVGQRDWPTPLGTFRVMRKAIDPTWDVPPSIQEEMKRQGRPQMAQVPPGPENPLGDRWIGLSLDNLGIHGTNAPASVPGFATHGCIRLRPETIRFLFDRVTPGTVGEIVYEPALLIRHEGRVFVEVHVDVYGRRPDSLLSLEAAADQQGVRDQIDWKRVSDVIRSREGLAIDVTQKPK